MRSAKHAPMAMRETRADADIANVLTRDELAWRAIFGKLINAVVALQNGLLHCTSSILNLRC